jgi:hypothetical protein
MFSDDDGDVLEPIPHNVTDIARAMVLRNNKGKPQINHTKAEAGMKDDAMEARKAFGVVDSTTPTVEQPIESLPREAPIMSMPPNVTQQVPMSALTAPTVSQAPKVQYFKDINGNEFKLVNGRLYSKGWFTPKAECRIINTKTGKVISSDGKTIQLFGWNEVGNNSSNNDDKCEVVSDIGVMEN